MVFDAIMTERSITRAAERLSMTQPAVSNALSRMRVAWKDELFVKDGRNIRPTGHAQNLWEQIKGPLGALSEAVDNKAFDPSTSQRTFRLAVADMVVTMAWAPLRKVIETEAPGVNIHAIPYTLQSYERLLENAEVDMTIGLYDSASEVLRGDFLFSSNYVCVMRNDHPLAHADVSTEEFAAAEHLLVTLSGEVTGYTDQVLSQHGLTRRIAMTMNHFANVEEIISQSNLIAVVPAGAVCDAIINGRLSAIKMPVELPTKQISMVWHKRQEKDGGLCWLRKHVKRIMAEVNEYQTQQVFRCLCKSQGLGCAQVPERHAS
ncbi:LysR family transcriptional regulator [Alteromonas sp. a30]|nr:LysR family transcriptional regulator [Alteromonas sp. a30]